MLYSLCPESLYPLWKVTGYTILAWAGDSLTQRLAPAPALIVIHGDSLPQSGQVKSVLPYLGTASHCIYPWPKCSLLLSHCWPRPEEVEKEPQHRHNAMKFNIYIYFIFLVPSFFKVSLTNTRQLNSCHVNLHDIHRFHLRPDLSWRNQTEPDFQFQTSMMWCQYVSLLYVSVVGSWHHSMMLILMHICLYFARTFAEEKQRPPNVLFIVADDLGKYY